MADPGFERQLLAIFQDEARVHLHALHECLGGWEDAPAARARAWQVLHTLKGAARAAGQDVVERLAHACEDLLAAGGRSGGGPDDVALLRQAADACAALVTAPSGRLRNQALALVASLDAATAGARHAAGAAAPPAPAGGVRPPAPPPPALERPAAEPIRIDGRTLDQLRYQVEAQLPLELTMRHQLAALRQLGSELAGASPAALARLARQQAQAIEALGRSLDQLGSLRGRLHDSALGAAQVPFGTVQEEVAALARSLAAAQGKPLALELEGAAVAFDRRLLGPLKDALIHLVTNAIDHGLEEPAGRAAAGKPPAGRLTLSARRAGERLLVAVADDGAGLDLAALRRAAHAAGLGSGAELAALAPAAQLKLALAAGVSTRAAVSATSGRGVGLGAAADRVAAAGGTLELESTPGQGTRVTLAWPASLGTVRVLVVECGGVPLALPLAGLDAVRRAPPAARAPVEGRPAWIEDGRVLPVLALGPGLALAPAPAADAVALLVRTGGRRCVLLADRVLGESEVLPRGLGVLLRRVRYLSGAAQLGDGRLAPVLALDELAQAAHQADRAPPPAAAPPAAPRRVLVAEDSPTARLLLRHILEAAGYAVDSVPDGRAALASLRQRPVDAVLSDIEMPHLDGLELTRALRADPATAGLPVVLVSALQSPEEQARGLEAGADAYLPKGAFDQDGLLATLGRLLDGRRA